MIENRLITEAYIEDDTNYEERMKFLLEKDDKDYEDEIFEKLGGNKND